jgi:HSP20 family protein
MAKLDKWFPFRFRRKKPKEKEAESGRRASSKSLQKMPARIPSLEFLNGGSLQRLVQSVFNDPFFREPFDRFADLERWFGDYSPNTFLPSIDITDEQDSLLVTAELPGMDKNDIQLLIEGDVLTLRGQKKNTDESKEKGVYRTERYYGYFHRTIPLPGDIDSDKVEAKFDKGLLTVRFPKKEQPEEKSTLIPIGEG